MRRWCLLVAALQGVAVSMELRVATHVGSRFLDKKVDMTVDGEQIAAWTEEEEEPDSAALQQSLQ